MAIKKLILFAVIILFSNIIPTTAYSTQIKAKLYELPHELSPYPYINIRVGGDDIESYKYNLKIKNGKWTGWSDEISIKKKINETELSDGKISIYVIGKNTLGNWQDFEEATFYEWKIDTKDPVAVLENPPLYVESNGSFSLKVSGDDIIEYIYNLNYNKEGWSGWSDPVSVEEELFLNNLEDGYYELRLLGMNSKEEWQFFYKTSDYDWFIDTRNVIGKFHINNEAIYTSSEKVILNMEKVKNAVSMAFSNNKKELENAEFEDFTIAKEWKLPQGLGHKTVFAVFQNKDGKKFYMEDQILLREPWEDENKSTDSNNIVTMEKQTITSNANDLEILYALTSFYIKEEDYESSKNICPKIKEAQEANSSNNTEIKIELDNLKKVITDLEEAYSKMKSEDFTGALEIYNKISDYIKDNNLNPVINESYINKLIRKSEMAPEILKVIESADEDFNNNDYNQAKEKYIEALKNIQVEKLDNIIPSENIYTKLKTIPININTDASGVPTTAPAGSISDSVVGLLINMLSIHIKDKNYTQANSTCEDLSRSLNSTGHEVYGLSGDKLDKLNEGLILLSEANYCIENGDYDSALEKYKEVYSSIEDGSISVLITKRDIENDIRKLEQAKELSVKLKEADEAFDENKLISAKLKYREVLKEIENNDLQEFISVADIKGKLNQIPVLTSRFYVNADLGIIGNPANLDAFALGWNLGVNFRINKLIAIGLGLDLFSIEAFVKLSVINTTFEEIISKELIIKPSFYFNIAPSIGFGGGLGIDYIIGFYGRFGIYIGVGVRGLYYFDYPNELSINMALKLGAVLHF